MTQTNPHAEPANQQAPAYPPTAALPTKEVPMKFAPGWLIFVSIAILLVVTIVTFRNYGSSHSSGNDFDEGKDKISTTLQPSPLPIGGYTSTYQLKKGKVTRVDIPVGFDFVTDGKGGQYYSQPEYQKKDSIGGVIPHHYSGDISFIDLSVYKEEIKVFVTFTPAKP